MKLKKIFISLLIILIVSVLTISCSPSKEIGKIMEDSINPIMGDINETVEDTGIVVFDDEYHVNSLVNGKITNTHFSEGDTVVKGQLLYSIDSIDLRNQIEQVSISLQKANEVYSQNVNAEKDLAVVAHASGTVTSLYCHTGDFVSIGTRIADIVDSNNLYLKIPFNSSDKDMIYLGAAAEITISIDGTKLYGTVSKVYDTIQAFEGGKAGVVTEISVVNPGALKQGDKAFAMIGDIASISSGELFNKTEQAISATQSGQVQELFINEGSKVYNGMNVMTIKNDALKNATKMARLQIKEIQTNLSQLKNKLSDYQITSPIDGIITKKIAKESDYATPNAPLAVLADDGTLYIDVDIDELYINKIEIGQAAVVSMQDYKDVKYNGNVIKKDDVGIAKNGVTYYTVRIKLDEHKDLMESMNVDVGIIINSKNDVMIIPTKALKGNMVDILVNKKVSQKEVVLGIKNKDYSEVISGISIEDKIVIGGVAK